MFKMSFAESENLQNNFAKKTKIIFIESETTKKLCSIRKFTKPNLESENLKPKQKLIKSNDLQSQFQTKL